MGGRGDGAGERAAGAGASLAAPPPLPSLGKFVGRRLRTSVAGQWSPDLQVNRKLEREEEEEEEEEACGNLVRDESLIKGSGGFLDTLLGSFPPR